MCIETNLLSGLTINHFPFYLLIFFGSWIYYTMIYVRSTTPKSRNDISVWYWQHLKPITLILFGIIALVMGLCFFLIWDHFNAIRQLSLLHWILMASVPLAGILYTFQMPVPFIKFRQVGWLKPIIIGITWSGWVTIFPVVVWQLQNAPPGRMIFPNPLLWLINFLFVTILAIVFDIKDYRTDFKKDLMTFPAQYGVTNTYNYILLPATILNIILVLLFQIQQAYTFAQIILQLLPFLLLLFIIYRKVGTRQALYYLLIVDGLMLLKGICGSVSIFFL